MLFSKAELINNSKFKTYFSTHPKPSDTNWNKLSSNISFRNFKFRHREAIRFLFIRKVFREGCAIKRSEATGPFRYCCIVNIIITVNKLPEAPPFNSHSSRVIPSLLRMRIKCFLRFSVFIISIFHSQHLLDRPFYTSYTPLLFHHKITSIMLICFHGKNKSL